ncbi:MAG: cell wall-binding repeat-containing protein [Acidimicrobiales bacterium]
MIGVTAGVASAATTTVSATVTSSNVPNIAGAATAAYTVGTVTITWSTTATFTTGVLTMTLGATSGTPNFTGEPTFTHTRGVTTATATTPATNTDKAKITKTGESGSLGIAIKIKDTSTKAAGTVTVTLKMTKATYVFKFTPTKVVVAHAPAAQPSAPTALSLTSSTRPITALALGKTSQAAGPWSFTSTFALNAGWTATDYVQIPIVTSVTTNCTATTDYVTYASAPKVSITTVGTTAQFSATPTFTVSTTHTSTVSAGCTTPFEPNLAKIKFTNSGKATKAGKLVLNVGTVKYTVGTGVALGNVKVKTAKYTTVTASTSAVTASDSNGKVTDAHVAANTPTVTLTPGAVDSSISSVKVVETTAGTIPKGYVCLTLGVAGGTTGTGNTWDANVTPTVKVTGGNATVTSKVTWVTVSTVKKPAFKVTAASTKTASTFVVSGLAVNATTGASKAPLVTAAVALTTKCAATGTNTITTKGVDDAVAFSTSTASSTQIYGATAAATAVKLVETSFTATGGNTCVGGTTTTKNNRPVIIATETHFQDALSSQYLASDLTTGDLLTTYGAVPSVTLQALKVEGVTQVDIVGGPLAVSTAVANQLAALPAYKCGGTSELTTAGKVKDITVTRIYGHTAQGTAEAIDRLIPSSHVMKKAFVGAYVGTNTTKGTGAYNDTSGLSSSPTIGTAQSTAIIASATEFQDAMAASTTSYWQTGTKSMPIILTNPTSLTATAAGALATTGVKQVILMGGPLAVTNSVVTTLESDGIEVLRVAGQTYTDTAAELAKFELATAGTTGLGWDGTAKKIAVARGNGYTDGLVGAVVAGKHVTVTAEPLLLTENPTTVGTHLTAFLKAYGGAPGAKGAVTTLEIFGGPDAVSPAVVSQMESDIS